MLLAAAGPGRAQFCNAAERKLVADDIVKIFNDLSVEHALICDAAAGRDPCEIACRSPQKISVDHRRRDVLPLLTAVAGIAIRTAGKPTLSVLTFKDELLAAEGRSVQLPAARALELYASLDAGKLDVEQFRADVAREFAEQPNATEPPALTPMPAVVSVPAAPEMPAAASASATWTIASVPGSSAPVPLPRLRSEIETRGLAAATGTVRPEELEAREAARTDDAPEFIPLPRRRPRMSPPRSKKPRANRTALSASSISERPSRE